MNAMVGEKLSIITSKAQTTRHRIFGIVNDEDYQIVFSDTPGIIKPAYDLQTSMMDFVKSAFSDADILIYMVEIGEKELKDEDFFNKIIHAKIPVLLLLNKIDKSNQELLEEQVQTWQIKVPNAEIFPISALEKFNVNLDRNNIGYIYSIPYFVMFLNIETDYVLNIATDCMGDILIENDFIYESINSLETNNYC